MKIISNILDIFSEKKCYACGQVWHFFCQRCQQSIESYKPYCYVCKKPSENFLVHTKCQISFPLTQVIVLTRYRYPPIKKALKHAKYYGKYKIYEDMIYPFLPIIEKHISDPTKSLLLPVPMNFFRKWKRGYNQCEKIASVLSDATSLEYETKLLTRRRFTKHQSHLSQSERLKNLAGAFELSDTTLSKDTIVYLVDDVISTGATLTEIAQLLQKNWWKDIRAVILASD